MAVFNIQRDFVYLAAPRTASRATVTALMKLEGSVEVGPHHCGLPIILEEHPEAKACSIIFMAVRNPYDILMSNHAHSTGTWPEWLKRRLSQPERLFRRFEGQFTEIAWYETLQEDLTRIVGPDVILELDPLHITQGKNMAKWKEPWITKVKEHFAKDFEEFGYA